MFFLWMQVCIHAFNTVVIQVIWGGKVVSSCAYLPGIVTLGEWGNVCFNLNPRKINLITFGPFSKNKLRLSWKLHRKLFYHIPLNTRIISNILCLRVVTLTDRINMIEMTGPGSEHTDIFDAPMNWNVPCGFTNFPTSLTVYHNLK